MIVKPTGGHGAPRLAGNGIQDVGATSRRAARSGTDARYNLRNARRARTAGLTTIGILVVVSVFMTYAYLDGVLSLAPQIPDAERSSATHTAPGPSIMTGGARSPTDEDIAAFVSLFPGTAPPTIPGRATAAATELQQPAARGGPTMPEQRVMVEHGSEDDVADPQSPPKHTIHRSDPIGSIATSRGEYSIHRDAVGRVFAERVSGEPATGSADADHEGAVYDE